MKDTYLDVKNKTIEWCKSLRDNGVYDEKKYNECVSDFIDIGQGDGIVPRDIPITSNKHSYGLHKENPTVSLEKMISHDGNTQRFRLGVPSTSGLYLAVKDDGTLRLSTGKDISKPSEIEWNINVQSGDTYTVSSLVNGSLLSVDRGDLVSARKKGVDPSSIWRIRESDGDVSFESVLHKGKKLTLSDPISITAGKSEAHNINITESNNETAIMYYDPSLLHSEKRKILGRINRLLRAKYIKLIEIRMLFMFASQLEDTYCIAMKKIIKNIDKENAQFKAEMKRMIPEFEYKDTNLEKDNFINLNFMNDFNKKINEATKKIEEANKRKAEERKRREAEYKKLLAARRKADALRRYNESLKARIPTIKDYIEEYNVIGIIYNKIKSPDSLKTLRDYSIFRKDDSLIRDDFPIKTLTKTCEDIRGPTFPVLQELIKEKRKHAMDLLKLIDSALNSFHSLNINIKREERNLYRFTANLKSKINDNERLIRLNQGTISSQSHQINELDDDINASLSQEKDIKEKDLISDVNLEKIKSDTRAIKINMYTIISICALALIMCVFSLMKFSNKLKS